MPKTILYIFLLVFLGAGSLGAQTLGISNKDITVNGSIGYMPNTTVPITNNANVSIGVRVNLKSANLLNGHKLSLCWADVCLPDAFPQDPYTIAAGETYYGLKVELKTDANAAEGVSTASFVIASFSGSKDSAVVNFTFNVSKTTGVTTTINRSGYSLSNAFPNPASESAKIICEAPDNATNARIRIYDVLGKEVFRQQLSGGANQLTVPVKTFKPGIYFFSLEAGEKIIATKRMIVTH